MHQSKPLKCTAIADEVGKQAEGFPWRFLQHINNRRQSVNVNSIEMSWDLAIGTLFYTGAKT